MVASDFLNAIGISQKTAEKKRQRTAALQDAVAFSRTPLRPRGFGVRLSSAAFISAAYALKQWLGELPKFCEVYRN